MRFKVARAAICYFVGGRGVTNLSLFLPLKALLPVSPTIEEAISSSVTCLAILTFVILSKRHSIASQVVSFITRWNNVVYYLLNEFISELGRLISVLIVVWFRLSAVTLNAILLYWTFCLLRTVRKTNSTLQRTIQAVPRQLLEQHRHTCSAYPKRSLSLFQYRMLH